MELIRTPRPLKEHQRVGTGHRYLHSHPLTSVLNSNADAGWAKSKKRAVSEFIPAAERKSDTERDGRESVSKSLLCGARQRLKNKENNGVKSKTIALPLSARSPTQTHTAGRKVKVKERETRFDHTFAINGCFGAFLLVGENSQILLPTAFPTDAWLCAGTDRTHKHPPH